MQDRTASEGRETLPQRTVEKERKKAEGGMRDVTKDTRDVTKDTRDVTMDVIMRKADQLTATAAPATAGSRPGVSRAGASARGAAVPGAALAPRGARSWCGLTRRTVWSVFSRSE